MKYLDCPLKYIGQTGRTFHTRCKEHTHAIRSNNGNSGYSYHIPNTGHTYGIITDTMDVIKKENKGTHLNTLEKYHTYTYTYIKLVKKDYTQTTHTSILSSTKCS
jgi:hypothetical protein